MVPAARAMEGHGPGAAVEAGAAVAVPAGAAATPAAVALVVAPGVEDHPATLLVTAVLAPVPKLSTIAMLPFW